MNIYCIAGDPVVRHGAEQLRRYAAKIADAALDVVMVHRYEPKHDGIWLGLREQFGDVFADPGLSHPLDDGFYIRSESDGRLLLAGVNGRSVLYAVYAYLESLGCRWVRMGVDGELLPKSANIVLDGYDVAEFPDYRYRGVCIEGGVSVEHALDMVEYMVKKRFNTYFIQFQNAYIFWSRWYDRDGEANTLPVHKAEEYTARLVAAVKERGLALQMVGHGWTCESLGQPGLGWIQTEMTLPPEKQKLLALVNGQRTWWKGVPIDTELCLSNAEAFRTLRDYIVSYAADHPEVDLLHVWMSDGWNNRCECDGCKVKRPSDWYVDLLNALDERLEAAGIDTKIVFLAYADLLWAPEQSRLRHQDRFILMFAPLTRTWRTTLLGGGDNDDDSGAGGDKDGRGVEGSDSAKNDDRDGATVDGRDNDEGSVGDNDHVNVNDNVNDNDNVEESDVVVGVDLRGEDPPVGGTALSAKTREQPTPFRLNKNTFPTSTAVNVHYFREWQNQFQGDSFAFDYHLLWKHSIIEPTGLTIARVLHEDIQDLDKLGLRGLINCQVQRYFFPTGLAMEVTGKTLWNKGLSFDAIKRYYFSAAYGENGARIQHYLERLSKLLDSDVLFEHAPAPDPVYQERLKRAALELEQLSTYVDGVLEAVVSPERSPDGAGDKHSTPAAASVVGDVSLTGVAGSLRYLHYGIQFSRLLLTGFQALAGGNPAGLSEAYKAAAAYLVEHEPQLHTVCDNRMWELWLNTYAAEYQQPSQT